MANWLGPIEIRCDAPSYPVVRACEELGFVSPLDVRWCRISHAHDGRPLGRDAWQWLFGTGKGQGQTCACGRPLPPLERYKFTFNSDAEALYLLGQCRQCRTVYWEDAPPTLAAPHDPAV